MTEDNLQTSEDDTTLAQANDETLSAGEYTYSKLREQINSGENIINLAKGNYSYTNGDGDTIEITTQNMVINGNGAVIDMLGSTIRAFNVNTTGVTIKNLTIKNANFNGNGSAIYFNQSGSVTNCNFVNNTASGDGGAVYFSSNGDVTNCNFTNNKATGDYSYGGAIYFNRDGTVTNCNLLT